LWPGRWVRTCRRLAIVRQFSAQIDFAGLNSAIADVKAGELLVMQKGAAVWKKVDTILQQELDLEDLLALSTALGRLPVDADVRVIDTLHVREIFGRVLPVVGSMSSEQQIAVLAALRYLPAKDFSLRQEIFDIVTVQLQKKGVELTFAQYVTVLDHLASLAVRGPRYPSLFVNFLAIFAEKADSGWDIQPFQVLTVLKAFSKAEVVTEKLRLLHAYVEDMVESGAVSPSMAIHLCHTMVCTRQFSAEAINALLSVACKTPLSTYGDDSHLMRALKTIECILRVDLPQTYSNLAARQMQFLNSVRDAHYADSEMSWNTATTYQVKHFLANHGFEAQSKMVGPFALRVCDPEQRIAFECLERVHFYPSTNTLRFWPSLKFRHLEASGWRVLPIMAGEWRELGTAARREKYIRDLLISESLIADVGATIPSLVSS